MLIQKSWGQRSTSNNLSFNLFTQHGNTKTNFHLTELFDVEL